MSPDSLRPFLVCILMFACLTCAQAVEFEERCKVLRGGELLEFVDCSDPDYVAYRFTDNSVKNRDKRILYSYVLTNLLFDDEDYEVMISQLLPKKEDRQAFIEAVFNVRDSSAWADGHAYAAYYLLLDLEDFQSDGSRYVDTAVLQSVSKEGSYGLSTLFLEDYVAKAKPSSQDALRALAQYGISESCWHIESILAAVGLAQVGLKKEAELVLNRIRNIPDVSPNALTKCSKAEELLEELPLSPEVLLDRLASIDS